MKARVIALYLPQYHPIPENDKTWGKGFTEWTNVAQAKPLFKGHYQPKLPADLGFYDLRLPEVREAQAELARSAGIEGFMYWHYWMGNGKVLLERPFQEVLKSCKPDFPFCLGWANHPWTTASWKKSSLLSSKTTIVDQLYPGIEDIKRHFDYVLPAFNDSRYIMVDKKPFFMIFDPLAIPNVKFFIETWRELSFKAGLNGIHFVGIKHRSEQSRNLFYELGFDAINNRELIEAEYKAFGSKNLKRLRSLISFKTGSLIQKYKYSEIIKYLGNDEDYNDNVYPTILSGYDRTPRAGKKAVIYYDMSPELFGQHVAKTLNFLTNKRKEHKIVILKSWNEWGEGNYIEPDLRYGLKFLDELRKKLV